MVVLNGGTQLSLSQTLYIPNNKLKNKCVSVNMNFCPQITRNKTKNSLSDANELAYGLLLPSAKPIDSSTMKLEVSRTLSCTGQSRHHDHQLRKARAVTIGQHFRGHRDQGAQQNSAHAFSNLANNQKEESFRCGTSPAEIQRSPRAQEHWQGNAAMPITSFELPPRSHQQLAHLENKRNKQQTKETTTAVLYLFSRTM